MKSPGVAMINKIQHRMEECAKYCLTPDLPLLRMKGPQLIFLWDGIRHTHSWLNQWKFGSGTQETLTYSAVTKQKFVPIVNTEEKAIQKTGILPASPKWAKYVENLPPGFNSELKRVSGNLIRCNHEDITFLDQHYHNTFSCRRIKLPILGEENGVPKEFKAWCWVYPEKHFTFRDYHDGMKIKFKQNFRPRNIQSYWNQKRFGISENIWRYS